MALVILVFRSHYIMKITREFGYHTLFWIVYTAIFTIVEGGYGNQFQTAFLLEIAFLPSRLVVVYFNYFILLPRFLQHRALTKYLVLTTCTILFMTIIHRIAMHLFVNQILFPNWDPGGFWQPYRFLQTMMIITSPLVLIIGMTIIRGWAYSEKRAKLLESEKLKAELNYLRAQINPHFFFNTLNNLYGLARQKSEKTAEVVMKLSELMDYFLYQSEKEKVPLRDEIEQLERYVALEQIRHGERFNFDLKMHGDIDGVSIPPLLLLPFLENSFKHGIHRSVNPGWISMTITFEEGRLVFILENSLHTQAPTTSKGGFGVDNLKKRLELLYHDGYTLELTKHSDRFNATLILHSIQ